MTKKVENYTKIRCFKYVKKCCRFGLSVKSPGSCRGTRFNEQHSQESIKQPLTSIPGESKPLIWASWGTGIYMLNV